MGLRERVYGLETEYAINFYPTRAGGTRPEAQAIVEVLQRVLTQQCGAQGTPYLVTGAKFHHDVGHAEWAHPECRSAREAAVYDKAADHLLAQILPEAQASLNQGRHSGRLLLAKNNVDFNGNTYGCHENYLMLHDNELLTGDHFLRYLARMLIPYLVTRQLFAGAGRLVSTTHQLSYEISQRAAFIDTIVSAETTKARPIFNTGREGEPLAGGNVRRLHLILGDANLSGWATWMKLGITGILLRMIEDLFLVDVPLFQNPLTALRSVAADLTGRSVLPLRDGRHMSALDIQNFYYERADAYLAEFGCSEEEDELMDAWENFLNDLAQDPMSLRNRVDWVMKKRFLDTYLSQAGLSWEQAAADKTVVQGLQAYDLRFHDLSREGLFNQVSYPDTIVTQDEIQRAQKQPPPYTRARIRGETVALARQHQVPIIIEKWLELSIAGQKLALADPLEFDHRDFPFYRISTGRQDGLSSAELAWLRTIATHQDRLIRRRAAAYLIWRQDKEATNLLREMVEHDPDELIRLIAIQAFSEIEDKATAIEVLINCLEDETPVIRWAAQEALEGANAREASVPSPQDPPDPDDGEQLIQLL